MTFFCGSNRTAAAWPGDRRANRRRTLTPFCNSAQGISFFIPLAEEGSSACCNHLPSRSRSRPQKRSERCPEGSTAVCPAQRSNCLAPRLEAVILPAWSRRNSGSATRPSRDRSAFALCDSSPFRLLRRSAKAARRARSSKRSSVAMEVADAGSPATSTPRSCPSASRGSGTIRATDDWGQVTGGSLPMTWRVSRARRHSSARGSVVMARVHASSPLRQRKSMAVGEELRCLYASAPITAKAAPRLSPWAEGCTQSDTNWASSLSREEASGQSSTKRRTRANSALRMRTRRSCSSATMAKASSAATDFARLRKGARG